MLNQNDIQAQSEKAWKQWKPLWMKNCNINREINKKSFKELLYKGKGKTLLQIAYGDSLSKNLDTIKKYKDKFDIYCCDKSFGYLMENGITPDYCHIADASVSNSWIKNQDTSKTILIANISSSPKWTLEWKGEIYFYTNWDNIGTANILGKIGNCYDIIPASSNVSNAMIVFALQVLGYYKQLLIGYDYSWALDNNDGLYYADCDSDKKYWMHHATVIDAYGKLVKTSSNLIFSCKWLLQFMQKYTNNIIINCSEQGIFNCEYKMPLKQAIGG